MDKFERSLSGLSLADREEVLHRRDHNVLDALVCVLVAPAAPVRVATMLGGGMGPEVPGGSALRAAGGIIGLWPAGGDHDLAGAGEIVEGLREEIDSEQTGADVSARRLDKLRDDFCDGKAIYLAYKVLSGYTHPGPTISGMYVESEQPLVTQLEPNRAAALGG